MEKNKLNRYQLNFVCGRCGYVLGKPCLIDPKDIPNKTMDCIKEGCTGTMRVHYSYKMES